MLKQVLFQIFEVVLYAFGLWEVAKHLFHLGFSS
jgi:hypothetical protein